MSGFIHLQISLQIIIKMKRYPLMVFVPDKIKKRQAGCIYRRFDYKYRFQAFLAQAVGKILCKNRLPLTF